MDQYNENNVNGHRTRPEFKKELDFYVPVGVILIELKDCYDDVPGVEPRSSAESSAPVQKQARQVGLSRNEFLEAEENTKEVGV